MSAQTRKPAILALEDGRVFRGWSFGAEGETFGEVIFNTSMTGYQEIFTDPSYRGQLVALTYPHIGNVGVNDLDFESIKPFLAGVIVREYSRIHSSWRAQKDLSAFLQEYGIPAIEGIDTRALTRHIRDRGAMTGVISTEELDPEKAVEKARQAPKLEGRDLVREVTREKAMVWHQGIHPKWLPLGLGPQVERRDPLHIIVYDFGVKYNILRSLAHRGCRLTIVPARTPAAEVLAQNPDGIFLSNGPGDPFAVKYAIETTKELLGKVPMFGICLGHQIMALALGAKTFKMKFGHHGANHPVKNLKTGYVEITAQNHGFAVDIDSLVKHDVEVTHLNLNDQTLEGFRHKTLPVFAVQYHPEASPGPHDSQYLFDEFVVMVETHRRATEQTGARA
ncbi:MAG: glutamine-hydrolyzing carbamoyl-phosphate synthase small subunit [Calditrichaeota bacterium]|nr:glutamine-hydrolyzing carbamoyl-phosphate synthase small subunit [Calditrichota bacterium]